MEEQNYFGLKNAYYIVEKSSITKVCMSVYFRSPGCVWDNYITMNLEGIVIKMKNWVDSAQDRDYWRALANRTSNLRVPYVMESVNV